MTEFFEGVAPAGATHADAPDAVIQQPAEPQISAGTLIRQAREAAGMHIAALAVSLKVPVKKLEALEQDRFDLLPDAVFVRALASSVCRTLKVDATTVLERLPQTSAPKLMYHGAGINAPFRVPGDGPGPSLWTQMSRPAVLAGLAFLLGALVLIFLPAVRSDALVEKVASVASSSSPNQAGSSGNAVAAADEGVKMGASPGQVVEVATPRIATVEAAVPAIISAAVVTGASSLAAPAAALVVPAQSGLPAAPANSVRSAVPSAAIPPVASAAATASPAPATPTTGLLTLQAKGDSWVEVVDAKGVVVLRRILMAGEVVGVSGTLPLATVIGRADATQVLVRGKALDLTAIARDNVARFEVK